VVKGAGYQGGDQLQEAFDYFKKPDNFTALQTMKSDL
jgi:hypothetical protein